MKPKRIFASPDLFRSHFDQLLNPDHPLLILAAKIKWNRFDQEIDPCFTQEIGRPGLNTRIIVGLLYLKATFNLSDETLLEMWVENPYWQAFCGFEYMQHEPPIHPTSLTKWRNRVGPDKFDILLKVVIETALEMKAIRPQDLKQVNLDTTVQEKAIAFPTDSRLLHKMRLVLVRRAGILGIKLKQTYHKAGKHALLMHSQYAHSKKFKLARSKERNLKTYLRRIVRAIRKCAPQTDGQIADVILRDLLERAERLLAQTQKSKNKIYSIHAPEVHCISKGKTHKRYEFGCKVSIVSCNRRNWVLGSMALEGNPYDGHTVASSIAFMEKMTGKSPESIIVDKGYKGHDYTGPAEVHIVKGISKKLSREMRRMLKRRAAIEPVIGHMKQDHRLDRNYLKGVSGDKINAIMAGVGFNLRKLLRWIDFVLNLRLLARLMALLRAEMDQKQIRILSI
jgi:IS5 family transposase